MHQELEKAGFTPAQNENDCDFFILNTCSVTSHADNQALYLIKQFKTKNQNAKIIVTGCFAQTVQNPESINAEIVLGNNEKLDIVKYIETHAAGEKTVEIENIFNIKDGEILSSIRCHTLGKINMSTFEKIIFLADKIEARTRNKAWREKILKVLDENKGVYGLNLALFICFKETIKSLCDRELAICPVTIDVYNWLLGEVKP